MKALSIRQPWAWLIVRPDLTNELQRARAYGAGVMKDIENRTWPTKRRGQVLVHAAAGMTTNEYQRVQSYLTYAERRDLGISLPPMRDLARGGIVGVVDIVDCVESSDSHWYMGAVGFKLANARPLPFIPFKGALQFFNVPDSILEGVDTL